MPRAACRPLAAPTRSPEPNFRLADLDCPKPRSVAATCRRFLVARSAFCRWLERSCRVTSPCGGEAKRDLVPLAEPVPDAAGRAAEGSPVDPRARLQSGVVKLGAVVRSRLRLDGQPHPDGPEAVKPRGGVGGGRPAAAPVPVRTAFASPTVTPPQTSATQPSSTQRSCSRCRGWDAAGSARSGCTLGRAWSRCGPASSPERPRTSSARGWSGCPSRSEFVAKFQAAWRDQGIRHFVLPPGRSELNGNVESAN